MPQYVAAIYPGDINYGAQLFKQIEENVSKRLTIQPTLFMGHFGFGLLDAVGSEATYITIMRNPIDRCISEYNFAKNNQFHHMHRRIHENKISIVDFFQIEPYDNIANIQSRILAANEGIVDWKMADRELLDRASANLERISLLGIQERFIDFLVMLSDAFPHFFVWNEKLNEGKVSLSGRVLPDEIEALGELCKTDVRLYEMASGCFDEKFLKIGNAGYLRDLIDKASLSIEQSRALFVEKELRWIRLTLHSSAGAVIKAEADGNGRYYVADLKKGDYETRFSNGAVGHISHGGGDWELKMAFPQPIIRRGSQFQ